MQLLRRDWIDRMIEPLPVTDLLPKSHQRQDLRWGYHDGFREER
jgi:hypothetical protein